MSLILALALLFLILAIVFGVYGMWALFGISIFLEVLFLMYMALGVLVITNAFYVKKRSEEEVHYQDVKFGVPDSVSILPAEKVTIKGCQGYDMVANFMKSRTGESHKYFLICHGYNSNKCTCNKYADVLLSLGYNTLCPDMRRCGETGGKGITFGVKECEDIELWIDYIYSIDKDAEISLYGISLGAASCCMVASRRDDIHMLVSYCSYSSLRDIVIDRMKHSNVPTFLASLLYPVVVRYTREMFHAKKVNTDIVDCIKRVKCPTLIMHSNGDRFTNIEHAYRLRQAKPEAMFVEFEGAPHARSYGVYPEEYRAALTDFVKGAEVGELPGDRFISKADGVKIETTKEDDNMTL